VLSLAIRQAWRVSSVGRRSQWPDSFKAIALKYWKLTRTFPLIGLNYEVIETATTVAVKWEILEISLISGVEEKIYFEQTHLMQISAIENTLNRYILPCWIMKEGDRSHHSLNI